VKIQIQAHCWSTKVQTEPVSVNAAGAQTVGDDVRSIRVQTDSEREGTGGTEQESQCAPETSEKQTQSEGQVSEVCDADTQTEAVGGAAGWQRLVFVVRKHAFLRRLRYCLTDYVKSHDGIYTRTKAE
jgi:hypothetical protein